LRSPIHPRMVALDGRQNPVQDSAGGVGAAECLLTIRAELFIARFVGPY
jgi:hypothetical protein